MLLSDHEKTFLVDSESALDGSQRFRNSYGEKVSDPQSFAVPQR